MSFLEKYKKNMDELFNLAVIKYDVIHNIYEFIPYSHAPITKNWDDNLLNLLIHNIINYCYYQEELSDEEYFDANTNLNDLIIQSIQERLNKKERNSNPKFCSDVSHDGLTGELLLDILIRYNYENSSMLHCRPIYQQMGREKQELTNYDLLYFIEKENNIELILGQVKTGEQINCITGIKSDLNLKYNSNYFGNAMCYIAQRDMKTHTSPILHQILRNINKISRENAIKGEREKHLAITKYLNDKNIKVIIPCLLFFKNEECYLNDILIEKKVKSKTAEIIKLLQTDFTNIEIVNFELYFYIFPCYAVNAIKEKLMKIKENSYEKI